METLKEAIITVVFWLWCVWVLFLVGMTIITITKSIRRSIKSRNTRKRIINEFFGNTHTRSYLDEEEYKNVKNISYWKLMEIMELLRINMKVIREYRIENDENIKTLYENIKKLFDKINEKETKPQICDSNNRETKKTTCKRRK